MRLHEVVHREALGHDFARPQRRIQNKSHDVAKHYHGFFIASGREVTDTLVGENASIGNHWGISLRDVKVVPHIVEVVIRTMALSGCWMVGAASSPMYACPDRDKAALSW
jgi:hypothetical protein